MTAKPYRVLSHTADTAIEADAPSFSGLIECLAYGMFDLMFDLDEVRALDTITVEVTGANPRELVVDALSELLYEAEARDRVFSSFSARTDGAGSTITVVASGSGIDTAELRGAPIKAVTYHALRVAETESGWHGRVYFDV